MLTFSMILLFTGFYFVYNTSKRAQLSNTLKLDKWLQENPDKSKILGLGLLALSFTLFCIQFGIGAGIIMAAILLMLISSIVILIKPIKFINFYGLIIILIFISFFELTF
ncbi:hypothetical protein [Urechidicola croceus]|uniref:Uncharacterized protein n=1 Tax=Urechidicola croceus TaxID=1850246 RepID=A0A1D8PB12_9FLAO|nr:hypothetical protein [Urechidicola croceus]AOW21756.1 hypothetical protein LPB138_14180 [Urechidicola croceus]